MNKYNHYTEAKSVADQLEKSGHSNFASEIRAALEEGSTGTEIFMMIRASLKKLFRVNDLQSDIFGRAKELDEKLSEALK